MTAPQKQQEGSQRALHWVTPEEYEQADLRYPSLTQEEIAQGRALVATWPVLTPDQWERVAACLGVRVAVDQE